MAFWQQANGSITNLRNASIISPTSKEAEDANAVPGTNVDLAMGKHAGR